MARVHLQRALSVLMAFVLSVGLSIPIATQHAYADGDSSAALDLGLEVASGYSAAATDMGASPLGKTYFSFYPSSTALSAYQEATGDEDATKAEMLQAWIDAITSVTIDDVELSYKSFDDWKSELTNAVDDHDKLLYYDIEAKTSYARLVLPIALFETDNSENFYDTKTVVIEADGFADVVQDVTYRNMGSDSMTVRVIDEDSGEVLYSYTLSDEVLRTLEVQERYTTPANCGMAGLRSYTSEGVFLTDILDAAGVVFSEGMTMKLRVNDDLESNGDENTEEDAYITNSAFTYEYILGTDRYYFPAMWDDETTYDSLDGRTVYDVLSDVGSDWDYCDYTDALMEILGDSAVQVYPMFAWSWSEGVIGWGGSDTTKLDYSGYCDSQTYTFKYGIQLDEDGNATAEATMMKNLGVVFGIDIVADESAIGECASGSHEWAVSWEWSDDFSSASATLVCETCGNVRNIDAEVATEEAEEAVVHTASVEVDGKAYLGSVYETLGHSYAAVVIDPTCTEAGYTTYTCTVCGGSYTADEVEATGHTAADAVVEDEVAATASRAGSYDLVVYCSVCGEELSRETVEVAALGYSFSDVQDASAYYYGPVYAVAEAGYMTGEGDGTSFGVGKSLNRQAMVVVLYRIFASDEEQAEYGSTSDSSAYADNATPLSDVKDAKYYTAAVNWAYATGVTTGYASGEFGVGDECSFQQFCTFLARALGQDGALTDAEAKAALASFADGSKVAAYADNSVAYLCSVVYDENGNTVVGGTAAGKLKPASSVSRERTATVVYRCMAAGLF